MAHTCCFNCCCQEGEECCPAVGKDGICCVPERCCGTNDGDPVCCPEGETCCGPEDGRFCCPEGEVCCEGECVPAEECGECGPCEECDGCTGDCVSTCAEGECCNDGVCGPCDCEDDEDCPEGECCVEGACVPCAEECEDDEDCPLGECCVEGECKPCVCETDEDCEDFVECIARVTGFSEECEIPEGWSLIDIGGTPTLSKSFGLSSGAVCDEANAASEALAEACGGFGGGVALDRYCCNNECLTAVEDTINPRPCDDDPP